METSSLPPQRDSSRPSVIRVALSGVCFLEAAFLAVHACETISILASEGLHSEVPGKGNEWILAIVPWAGVNIISMALVGIGLLRRRAALTAIGGCTLVLSTFILFTLKT